MMRYESPGLPHTIETAASRWPTAARRPASPIPPATAAAPTDPTTPASADAFLRLRLGALTGTVLEIGPGTGPTLAHYCSDVHWIGAEPDTSCHPTLRSAARRLGLSARIIGSGIETLDLPAQSVDAVVSSFALCSVTDQPTALQVVRQVLRPGGVLAFQEHVAAAPGTLLRHGQRLLALLSRRGGCHPDRDTAAALRLAGFDALRVWGYMQSGPMGIRIPHIVGEAQRHAA